MDLATIYWAQTAGRAFREQFGHEAGTDLAVQPPHAVWGDSRATRPARTTRRIVRRAG